MWDVHGERVVDLLALRNDEAGFVGISYGFFKPWTDMEDGHDIGEVLCTSRSSFGRLRDFTII